MDLIIDRETIALWPGEAPYTAESPDQRQPSLMPYPIDGAKGAVVVLPGGGYCMKADHEGRAIAEMINAAGVSAYVLDYRVRPCHYLAPLSDAQRAIRLVRSMGYEKVAILGFSASGFPASYSVAAEQHRCPPAEKPRMATLYDAGNPDAEDPVERLSSRPDGFIPCYAVVSFTAFRHQGSVDALLGEKKTDYALLRHFSAELNVTADTPPAFIWHTSPDEAVPVENSLNLAAALSHAGVSFELHVFPVGHHGLGLAESVPQTAQWAGLCQKWLLSQGYGRE